MNTALFQLRGPQVTESADDGMKDNNLRPDAPLMQNVLSSQELLPPRVMDCRCRFLTACRCGLQI